MYGQPGGFGQQPGFGQQSGFGQPGFGGQQSYGGGYNEHQLMGFINQLFMKYDMNRSGRLSLNELAPFLNELFPMMGYQTYNVDYNMAQQVLYQIDSNCDGQAGPYEIKRMFEQFVNSPNDYGFQGGYQQPPGFGQQQGYGQPGFGGQPGVINLGGQWGGDHDYQLRQQIDYIFRKYDQNRTGQIDQGEFFPAYQELCQMTGQPAPQDFYSIQQIAQQTDQNFDGRISPQEMFNLFKGAQFNMW